MRTHLTLAAACFIAACSSAPTNTNTGPYHSKTSYASAVIKSLGIDEFYPDTVLTREEFAKAAKDFDADNYAKSNAVVAEIGLSGIEAAAFGTNPFNLSNPLNAGFALTSIIKSMTIKFGYHNEGFVALVSPIDQHASIHAFEDSTIAPSINFFKDVFDNIGIQTQLHGLPGNNHKEASKVSSFVPLGTTHYGKASFKLINAQGCNGCEFFSMLMDDYDKGLEGIGFLKNQRELQIPLDPNNPKNTTKSYVKIAQILTYYNPVYQPELKQKPSYASLKAEHDEFVSKLYLALLKNAKEGMIIYIPANKIKNVNYPLLVVNKKVYNFVRVEN